MVKTFVIWCVLLVLTSADIPVDDQIDEGGQPVVALSLSEAAQPEPGFASSPSRLFATLSTTTTTRYLTARTCSVTTSCAFLYFNALSACRRRRGLDEQPIILALDDDVQPSAPLA